MSETAGRPDSVLVIEGDPGEFGLIRAQMCLAGPRTLLLPASDASGAAYLAENLLQVIANGFQPAFLREPGCDEAQGHHFSKPLPTRAFESFMRQAQRGARSP
jgi:hypothetical protein